MLVLCPVRSHCFGGSGGKRWAARRGRAEAQVSGEPVPGRFMVCVDVDSRREGRHSEAALGRDALGSRPAAWSRQLCPLRASGPVW